MKDIFTEIYNSNLWENPETVSGDGSTVANTITTNEKIVEWTSKFGSNVVDIPCGDFNFMRLIAPNFKKYIGIDIVDELMENNKSKYNFSNCEFLSGNVVNFDYASLNMAQPDIIIIKDCFIHLSNKNIFDALKNLTRSNIKYLVANNYVGSKNENGDVDGGSRPINLSYPPFSLPASIDTIFCDKDWKNKQLSIWRISDITMEESYWEYYTKNNKTNNKPWYFGLEGNWWWGMTEEQFLEEVEKG